MDADTNQIKTRRPRIRKPAEYYQSEEYKQEQSEYQKKQEIKIIEMTLDSSMRTQTAIIPKPTYEELEKRPFLARITAQLETNNHDGYCSDEDCKYTRKTVNANIVVPDEYKDSPVGKIMDTRVYKWANHLPLPDINYSGSGYCRFNKPKRGVGQHEYRYTIKKVEIVENNKYKKENVESEATDKSESEPKKSNKNGYIVMASEGGEEYYRTDYKNEPYGYSDTLDGAREIAIEAICFGTKRDEKWSCDDEGGFEGAEIFDLDNMKKVGLLNEELQYYRVKSRPPDVKPGSSLLGGRKYCGRGKTVEVEIVKYTEVEKASILKELYDKMIEAKKTERI